MSDKISVAELRTRIAQNIKKCDINVSQLAQITHISNAEMLDIVHGNTLPSIDVLRKLSETLNIPLSYFFE
ncbi:MAG: helix-turn-helix domain-containing protein [Clostridia bacterium]|nr:helix-turn-helix domain-containing protein [Clostridia bacterium]MDE6472241.1 helix-turn-helix domain-containing protein [Clostridia bacterium]